MSKPRNPHVLFEFDSEEHKNEVSSLGIDVADGFLFAFADHDKTAGCPQIKTAVLTQSESEFDRLLPLATAAGIAIPDPIVQYVKDPGRVFLQDCCLFSRDVQVIALAGPQGAVAADLKSVERTGQSLIIEDNDRNPDPTKRSILRLRINPNRIQKNCKQL